MPRARHSASRSRANWLRSASSRTAKRSCRFLQLLDESLHEQFVDARMLRGDQVAVDDDVGGAVPLVDDEAAGVLDVADDVVGAGDAPAADQVRVRAPEPES